MLSSVLFSSGYWLYVAESECLKDDDAEDGDGLVGHAGDCDERCGVDADAEADAGMSAAHNGDLKHFLY